MAEENRIRKHKLQVYLSEAERKVLSDKADYVGLNASQFIRRIIVADNITRLPVKEIKETSNAINEYKYEIHKIGVNINQLVKIIHENNDLYFEEQIQETVSMLGSVAETFEELTRVMYEKLYNI